MIDGRAQTLAHSALGQRGRLAQQLVVHFAPCGSGHLEHAIRPAVESRHALQKQVAQAARKLTVVCPGGCEELLGEEGVALRASHDGVSH